MRLKFLSLLKLLIVGCIGGLPFSASARPTFEYDTKAVLNARQKIARACTQNPESRACRGSWAYCTKNPYDSFCARGARTDCSLFPFLKECGGTNRPAVFDRPELICQRYPFSPVCQTGFCRFHPGSIGCGDRLWGWPY